jgi:hypothetical protein
MQLGDESETGAAAAAATAKLTIHAARDREKGACRCVDQNKNTRRRVRRSMRNFTNMSSPQEKTRPFSVKTREKSAPAATATACAGVQCR